MTNCDHCWTDSVRNGRCTEPSCDAFGQLINPAAAIRPDQALEVAA